MDYALVTPVRNEAENLPRLAASVVGQTRLPSLWVIVDNGSTDETPSIARRLAGSHGWIRVLETPGEVAPTRGAPIVRAFLAGLAALVVRPDVIVKLDADVSFPAEHFEQLLDAFAADPSLGMASGTCWELERGEWRPRFSTRSHVRGAVRAYRRECLEQVLPLEERMGWDGIDEIKAAVRGWRTASLAELPFFHHRNLGERESRLSKWSRQGEMAYFMGYRPSYLALRAVFRMREDLTAPAMIWGYARAALARSRRCADPTVRAHLRREQALRRVPRRVLEAVGHRAAGR